MTAAQAFSDPDLTFEERYAHIQKLALAGDEEAIDHMEGMEMARPWHERLVAAAEGLKQDMDRLQGGAGAGDGTGSTGSADTRDRLIRRDPLGRLRTGRDEGDLPEPDAEDRIIRRANPQRAKGEGKGRRDGTS